MPRFRLMFRSFLANAVLAAGLSPGVASAADWYTGAPSDQSRGTTASLDLSIDATSQRSDSLAVIGTIAPFAPMEQSGVRLRLGGVLGQYSYISTTVGRVQGKQEEGSALGGYEWVAPNATFSLYGGVTVRSSNLTPVDPNNPVKGTQVGFKVATDFYVNPNAWTMAAGTASFSTANSAYYARFKTGIAITENVFIGPEVTVLGDKFFSQWRVGGHVSGFTVGRLQVGVSGGYLSDKVRGSGVYGSMDGRVTF